MHHLCQTEGPSPSAGVAATSVTLTERRMLHEAPLQRPLCITGMRIVAVIAGSASTWLHIPFAHCCRGCTPVLTNLGFRGSHTLGHVAVHAPSVHSCLHVPHANGSLQALVWTLQSACGCLQVTIWVCLFAYTAASAVCMWRCMCTPACDCLHAHVCENTCAVWPCTCGSSSCTVCSSFPLQALRHSQRMGWDSCGAHWCAVLYRPQTFSCWQSAVKLTCAC